MAQNSDLYSSPHGKTPSDIKHIETSDTPGSRNDTEKEDSCPINNALSAHHDEPPMTFRRVMSLIAMAFLWTGSQIPVYIFGGIPPIIYSDIGGADRWIWFVIANLLALAAVCPFVGSLSDLIGRRYVALSGSTLICLGMIVASTAHTMNIFISGMAIAGAGAGVSELTALAVASELAPTRKRGKYVAVLIFTIFPFTPSVLWGQLISAYAGWRYCGALCGAWAGVGLIMTALFYFPPPRPNTRGFNRKQVLAQIDYVGGILSISGLVLFMAGLQWGGYQVRVSPGHCTEKCSLLTMRQKVQMDVRPCPHTVASGRSTHSHLLRLGSIRCSVPHVSFSAQTGTAGARIDPRHHIHLRYNSAQYSSIRWQ